MSILCLRRSLERVGVQRSNSARAAAAVLSDIELELASNGVFNFRGIGRLEVVANRLIKAGKAPAFGGSPAQPAPVRVRFVASRELKARIAKAHRA